MFTGFVGSGPVVLILEGALHMGAHPTAHQRNVLSLSTAAVILLGDSRGPCPQNFV